MVARGRKLIAFREVEGVAHDDSDLKSNRKVVAGKKESRICSGGFHGKTFATSLQALSS